jgi:hypothetical protein
MGGALMMTAGMVLIAISSCPAQQTTTTIPDAPAPQPIPAHLQYRPPTQQERLRSWVRHTFSIYSVVEAGVRGGIDQATDSPSEWPEGAEGFGDRFGSAFGQIVVRGTTEYAVADAFREDIRFSRCDHPCPDSTVKRALEDTFTARKGDDGHRAFSFARLVGPIAAGVVVRETWYPGGYGDGLIVRETAVNYGFSFLRNWTRELTH